MNQKLNQIKSPSRVTLYDWLRLIATIFVVVGHSPYLIVQSLHGEIIYELPAFADSIAAPIIFILRKIATWIYGFHMPLFIFLSGAVLALKPIGKFDSLVKAKAKRLLIPYYTYGLLFTLPVKRLSNFYNNTSWVEAMKAFLYGAEDSHMWFLPALFWCTIVFVLLYKLLDRIKWNNIYSLLLVSGICQFVCSKISFDIFFLQRGLKYIFYFALGYAFETLRQKNFKWGPKKNIPLCLVLLVIEVLHYGKYHFLNDFFLALTGSALTLMFAGFCDRVFRKVTLGNWWKVLIRSLFYVYIFHDPFEFLILRIYMNSTLLASAFGCISYAFMRTIGVFLISALMGECIYRLKKSVAPRLQ